LNSVNEILLVLKKAIDTKGLNKQCFKNLLLKDNGVRALFGFNWFL
jgi:hypothetical protein